MEIIYKAVDGKTFANQQDCENHEAENCLPSGALYYYEKEVHKPTTFMEEEKMMQNMPGIWPLWQCSCRNTRMRRSISAGR